MRISRTPPMLWLAKDVILYGCKYNDYWRRGRFESSSKNFKICSATQTVSPFWLTISTFATVLPVSSSTEMTS